MFNIKEIEAASKQKKGYSILTELCNTVKDKDTFTKLELENVVRCLNFRNYFVLANRKKITNTFATLKEIETFVNTQSKLENKDLHVIQKSSKQNFAEAQNSWFVRASAYINSHVANTTAIDKQKTLNFDSDYIYKCSYNKVTKLFTFTLK